MLFSAGHKISVLILKYKLYFDITLKAYEIWARLVEEHGHLILRQFAGYHDEALKVIGVDLGQVV